MATIGNFTKSGADWTGEVITLSVQSKDVRIAPNPDRESQTDASHLVFVGRAEIGQARLQASGDLVVTLDDPSFAAEITALLVGGPDGETFKLIWQRSRIG